MIQASSKTEKVVQLANTYAGYVFVKEANGKSGWIAESEVKAILPFNGKSSKPNIFNASHHSKGS